MGLDELRALLALLREHGVHSYRSGEIQLELGRAVVAQPADEAPAKELTPTEVEQAALDLLFRSSGNTVRLVPRAKKAVE